MHLSEHQTNNNSVWKHKRCSARMQTPDIELSRSRSALEYEAIRNYVVAKDVKTEGDLACTAKNAFWLGRR